MGPWSSLVDFIARTLGELLWLYELVVIASVVMSWIEPNPYNPIVRFVYSATEPLFDWIRERLPVLIGGIDLSPLVVIIGILFLQQWLIPNLQYALTGAYSFN